MSCFLLRLGLINVKGEAVTLTLFFSTMLVLILLPIASAQNASSENGKTVFQTKCSSCHTIGGGDLVGPDLKNVTNTREHAWLVRMIKEPDKLIAEGDPIVTQLLQRYSGIPMPNLGLSQQDTEDVIAYIANQSGGPQGKPPEKPPAAPEPVGNYSTGESLFEGNTQLKSGGPPCQACHNVKGVSVLGGGNLGVDLTSVYERYGDNGLASVLATLPFPTMRPIYDSHPLTEQEQADLKVFFKEAPTRPVEQSIADVGWLSIIGLAIAILIIEVVWRNRVVAIRKPMVEETLQKKEMKR